MVEISFVIPAYNVEKYIERCLDSIYHQDIEESLYEVIVIDDGSTDRTMQILERIQQNHKNLYVFSQQNQGPGSSRNLGIDKSKGKYIWFVDADDYLLENSMSAFFYEIEDEDIEIFCFPFKLIQPDGSMYDEIFPHTLTNRCMAGKDAINKGFNKWAVWMSCWNKDYINRIKLRFLPDVIRGEDALFAYIGIIQARKIKIIDTPLYVYERKQGGLTTVNNFEVYKRQRFGDIRIAKSLNDLFLKYKNVDREMSTMIRIHFQQVHFGLTLSLFMNKKRYRKLRINKEVVKQMKNADLYPLKPPFYSLKKKLLSYILNIEFLIV